MSRLRNILTSSHFWKPNTRRSPRLRLDSSLSIVQGQLGDRLGDDGAVGGGGRRGRGALWHIPYQSDECKYLFVNHLFHCFIQVSNQIVACWVTGKNNNKE